MCLEKEVTGSSTMGIGRVRGTEENEYKGQHTCFVYFPKSFYCRVNKLMSTWASAMGSEIYGEISHGMTGSHC